MDEVVKQNTSLVEEAAANSEKLSCEAEEMQRLMGSFKVNGDNGNGKAKNIITKKEIHWEKSSNLAKDSHFTKNTHFGKSAQPAKEEKEAELKVGGMQDVKKNSDSIDHFAEF